MVCESTISVAGDCDLIIRSDLGIDAMLGLPMTGLMLSQHLSNEEEKLRLQHAFEQAYRSPILIPITFVDMLGSSIAVELLIVYRHYRVSSAMRSQHSFLVGVRAEREGKISCQPGAGSDIHAFDGFSAPGNTEGARTSSLADSSSPSEMVFRHLETSASPPSQESMAAVKEFGILEHWYIQPTDLEVEIDQVLGAGGFGVVYGGSYLGTPIAVKVCRSEEAE
eukprot:CAMPEP_0180556202 /NCGR_PEP_ID=MMETSP1037_2-20121125/448_1 /TAXON_ID=632150 /ORGANISM="Azadinium spinosum, Strain 3D9" /LENGTH=222 /DNA_ID=CAMNT_0022572213 /DNA_START=680 /DNA_END=1345 /DNA_ORIENTATION=-